MLETARKKIALITTELRFHSHSQHMGDRFLVGYPRNGRWHRPPFDLVSMYVDQHPDGDLTEARSKEFGIRVYPTIAEALTLGGEQLAVDAVLLIGEHGDYPRNEKGQILYPRYEFFQQIVAVFEQSGRAAPVFNDKHLSYSFEKARHMAETSRRLGFPLLAGSSLPWTWRLPELELPLDCELDDALMIGMGSSDALDFHALECLQCMVERRRGGESGVKRVQLLEGADVWRAGADGRWSRELLEAALARSDSRAGVGASDGRPQDLAHSGELEELATEPAAYLIDRNDGLRTTLLMLNGAVQDFTFAARRKGQQSPVSTQFLLAPHPNVAYSARLMQQVEEMFATGRTTYPIERTLLVSGTLEQCLTSKVRGHAPLKTPELNVAYRAPAGLPFGDP